MRKAQDGWPNRIGSPQVSQRTPPISMISQGLSSDSSYSELYTAVKGSHAMWRIRAVLWLMSEFCPGLMECKVAGLMRQDDLQNQSVF